jgi:alpha/beta superfamily hydrolase
MARRIESLFVAGPAGRLEAILEEPEHDDPVEAALVCHPNPKGGGTMHNKVVYRLARGLRKAGCAVLRFNYRGVNLSEGTFDHGVGETEDARAALAELRRRYPALPTSIAGFSFGSRIALHIALADPALARVIAVGFPTSYGHNEYVTNVTIQKYFIQSTNDEFGPRPEMERFFDSLHEPKEIAWVESADHFFRDSLEAYEHEVLRIGSRR